MALTMALAPEVGLMIRTAMIGRMTLSFEVTVALDVVAASHRTDSCCADASPAAVGAAPFCGAVAFPANGRKGSAEAETLDFFLGESNLRSWSMVACFLLHFPHVGRWVQEDARCPWLKQW